MLSLQARKKFKIVADPFTGDVTKAEDVYMTSDTRFIAEYLYPVSYTHLTLPTKLEV